MARRRVVSEEDVGEGVTGFLAWKMGEEDTFYRWKIDPILQKDWTNGVDYNNHSGVLGGCIFNELVAIVPSVEAVIVTVSVIAIHCVLVLAGIYY